MIRQLQILGYRIEPPKPQANQISEPVDLCQVEILFSEDRRFRLLTLLRSEARQLGESIVAHFAGVATCKAISATAMQSVLFCPVLFS